MTTLLLATLMAAAPTPTLTVVFLPAPNAPGPTLVVQLEERARGVQAGKAVLVGPGEPRVVEVAEKGPGRPGGGLPVGPERVGLRLSPDGAVLLTVKGVGLWQTGLPAARRGGVRGEGVLVAEPDTLRLSIESPAETCAVSGCAYSALAKLVGTTASVAGVAWVSRGRPPAFVVSDGRSAWSADATVIAATTACAGRAVDVAIALGEDADVKVTASGGKVACGAWAVTALEGERVNLRARRTALRGIAIR